MAEEFLDVTPIGTGRFILKHWYLIILLIVIVPIVISSINTAIKTNNPSYPFVTFALSTMNSDAQIYSNVAAWENSSYAFGITPPVQGIWYHAVYFFKIFLVIWNILGLIFLISLPMVIIYHILKWKNPVHRGKNVLVAILIGFIWMFFVNLIYVIYLFVSNNPIISVNQNLDKFSQMWIIIKLNLPFHGIAELIKYIIHLSIS